MALEARVSFGARPEALDFEESVVLRLCIPSHGPRCQCKHLHHRSENLFSEPLVFAPLSSAAAAATEGK